MRYGVAPLAGLLFLALSVCGAFAAGAGPLPEDMRLRFTRPAAIPHPAHNPWTQAKEELGRMLFFDPLLSGGQVRSCATCHNPSLSWGDGLARAMGEGQKALSFRSPTLLNMAWLELYGWDGKFKDLESVAFVPISGPGNMNADEGEVIARLSAISGYRTLFAQAFTNGAITRRNIELALGVFQRMLVSGTAPFDLWIAGDQSAISPAARRGFSLFTGKAECAQCHDGWAFTDGSFHDIGLASSEGAPGRGRLFPTSVKLQHAFKTPGLRNVAVRAPYMHDGSVATLAEVVDHYARGGANRPSRAREVHPLNLSEEERADLVAFMETLTEIPHAFPVPVLPR